MNSTFKNRHGLYSKVMTSNKSNEKPTMKYDVFIHACKTTYNRTCLKQYCLINNLRNSIIAPGPNVKMAQCMTLLNSITSLIQYCPLVLTILF